MPETTTHQFSLCEVSQRSGASSHEVIDATAELAEPSVVCLSSKLIEDDPELQSYVQQHSEDYRFDWVGFACGFSGPLASSIQHAWLSVRLSSDGQNSTALPVALSMAPLRLSDQTAETAGFSFEIGVNAGVLTVGSGVEHGAEVSKEHLFIAAYGLSKPRARWEFHRTPTRKLEGMFRVSMIMRSHRSVVPCGKVELTAEISRRRFGIFEKRSQLDDPASISFSAQTLT